jgi:hypothetical protein
MLSSRVDEMVSRLHELQEELEAEIEQLLSEKREQFRYTLEQGRVRFEREVRALQRRHKTGLWTYLRTAQIGHIVSAPVIYSLLIPFVFLDIAVTLYQHICFRIYGIPRVVRNQYILIDRQHLAYLNVIEKFNCVYCGYANGLTAYVREVAARTEQYWCPIKHAQRTPDPHRFADRFVDYGDADAYKDRLREIQKEIMNLHRADAAESSRDAN